MKALQNLRMTHTEMEPLDIRKRGIYSRNILSGKKSKNKYRKWKKGRGYRNNNNILSLDRMHQEEITLYSARALTLNSAKSFIIRPIIIAMRTTEGFLDLTSGRAILSAIEYLLSSES